MDSSSAKRNASEIRGQNLKFGRCVVRYQSTYIQTGSTLRTSRSPFLDSLTIRFAPLPLSLPEPGDIPSGIGSLVNRLAFSVPRSFAKPPRLVD